MGNINRRKRKTTINRNISTRQDLYQEITNKFIAQMEQGKLPWVQPWDSNHAACAVGLPVNASTQRRYSGINVLILWGAVFDHGFTSQNWLTFKQAKTLGGSVCKGEKGQVVCYADRFTPQKEREHARSEGRDPQAIPFLKRYRVFNIEQCENLPEDLLTGNTRVWTQFSQHLIAKSCIIDKKFRAFFSNLVANLLISFILQKKRSTMLRMA